MSEVDPKPLVAPSLGDDLGEVERGVLEPERERRGILSTLSDVSLCEALLLPTDLLLAGGGAINPSVACDVPARWLLVLPWMWMVEDPLGGCCAGGGSIDPSSKSMSNCVSLSPSCRFCGSPAGDLCG
jgi:hypothetical protein